MKKRKVALLLTAAMLATSVFPAGITAYAEEAVSPDAAVVETGLDEMPEESVDVSADDALDLQDENVSAAADAAQEEAVVEPTEAEAQPDVAAADELAADETVQDVPAEDDMQDAPIVADGGVVVSDIEVMTEASPVAVAADSINAIPLTVGNRVTVKIVGDGSAYYSFRPLTPGYYTIVSYSGPSYDPMVTLYNSLADVTTSNYLKREDDIDLAHDNLNFLLTYNFTSAGKDYYFEIKDADGYENDVFDICIYRTDANGHCWGPWSVPTAGQAVRARTCVICNKTETQNFAPVLALTANKLTMKTKQTTSKFKVTTMAEGDSLLSVKSNKTKLLKVSNVNPNGTFKLKAQGKTGTAKLTITLKSGATKTVKVKIQTAKVKTTKVKVSSKKLTLKKKQKHKLTTVITPVTSSDKVNYSTSNKKVATVSKKGQITAKGKGKATITVRAGNKSVKVKVAVK